MDKQESAQPDDPGAALRGTAIDLFINGHKPTAICRQLNRSRTWFYKTLGRYRQGGREGLRSRSRAPHHVHNRTLLHVETAIVRLLALSQCSTSVGNWTKSNGQGRPFALR